MVIALIAMDKANDAVCGDVAESVTVTVKGEVPATVGVPEITPVALSRVSPVGRDPAVIDHVKGAVPWDAERVWLYATFVVPSGKVAGEILIPVAGIMGRALLLPPQPANMIAMINRSTQGTIVVIFFTGAPFVVWFRVIF
jgi:hypothetical protein